MSETRQPGAVEGELLRLAHIHRARLVLEDEHGDFIRCDCGEQGYDFDQGRVWYIGHLFDVERIS